MQYGTSMKRSDAIRIIGNFLYELNVEPEETDAEADLILSALEDSGMMPPLLPFEFVVERIMEDGVHAELHEWESDDEN